VTLRVIGAGLGRTGTNSLKLALERLLAGACYHTHEVVLNLHHVPLWQDAVRADDGHWDRIFAGYRATVDWPACRLWPQLMRKYPDALVLLSTRDTAEQWWDSASQTVFASMKRGPLPGLEAWYQMMRDAMQPFTDEWDDKAAAIAAYERHNCEVRAAVPAARLIEWQPQQGWGPLCDALAVTAPNDPFPHVNTRGEFRALAALDR
jgi:hypothetical protein